MNRYVYMLAVLLISIVALGCAQSENRVSFERIAEGIYAPFPEKAYFVIRNDTEYLEFWNKTGMIIKNPDFEKYSYLALFMGERPTGGYMIAVKEIVKEGDKVKVYIELAEPSETCFVTQEITRPFLILRVEKIEGDVVFVEETKTINC
ncbi:protease complex subunit PrcB family protein [Geoglobus acetivorans]|uniref:PrcB C-terminal domain-containing protein n=1 Tax=Geoglobus acetivorans TaxID=565033 RepID=A0A0A7GET8_GEOAI|nr:hypothetical protein GACE_0423 [Geoglobus acetivorans]